jgi:hypothetical protein
MFRAGYENLFSTITAHHRTSIGAAHHGMSRIAQVFKRRRFRKFFGRHRPPAHGGGPARRFGRELAPLRLLLGSDAYGIIMNALRQEAAAALTGAEV